MVGFSSPFILSPFLSLRDKNRIELGGLPQRLGIPNCSLIAFRLAPNLLNDALDFTGMPGYMPCSLQYSKFLFVSYALSASSLFVIFEVGPIRCSNSLQSPTLSFVIIMLRPSPVSSLTVAWNFAHDLTFCTSLFYILHRLQVSDLLNLSQRLFYSL